MKKFFTAVALAAMTLVGQAQECAVQDEPNYNGDEAGCRQAVSLYTEFLKQENFKDAAKEWWKAQEICPQYKPLLYDNGKYIYKKMAQAITDKNSDDFKNKMDTLNLVYDLWIKNFNDCYELQMKRAHDNMMDENHRYNVAFKYFQMAFANTPKEKLQSYDAVYYFRSAYFMVGAKLIDCGQMMDIYTELDALAKEKIEEAEAAGNTGEVQNWKTTQQTLESYIVPCASCDVLIPIFKKKTDAEPDNLELKKEVLGKLEKLECEDDYVLDLVRDIDAVEPTAISKMQLGNAYYAKKEMKTALGYYQEAISRDDIDEETKNATILKMAKVYLGQGSYKNAHKYAGMISGCEAKFIQAQAVAGTAGTCAENRTQRTAVYSYALDLADAAGSCASSTWKSNLVKQLSTKQDLFTEGLNEGDSYDVPCWGVKTKLRINK
jgi:tetratricopeptide (TPR) repeat protein